MNEAKMQYILGRIAEAGQSDTFAKLVAEQQGASNAVNTVLLFVLGGLAIIAILAIYAAKKTEEDGWYALMAGALILSCFAVGGVIRCTYEASAPMKTVLKGLDR